METGCMTHTASTTSPAMHLYKKQMLTASVDRQMLSAFFDKDKHQLLCVCCSCLGGCVCSCGCCVSQIQTSCKVGTAVVDLQMSKLVVMHFSAELLCDSALLCSDSQRHAVPCHICDQLLVCCASWGQHKRRTFCSSAPDRPQYVWLMVAIHAGLCWTAPGSKQHIS